jgi:integrase
MCTYLNKTGSTYYFRRPVPDDLMGQFKTERGNPRSEWKRSLGTKDREIAKRLLRPHEIETDHLIVEARCELSNGPAPTPHVRVATEQEREEKAALAALETMSGARRVARSELRTLWRQRRHMSTAELSPEQAAAVDLIRERDAEVTELRAAAVLMQLGNDKLGLPRQLARPIASTLAAKALHRPEVSLSALFEDFAISGAATAHTVAKWRAAIIRLVEHLGHDDAAAVTRADLSGWLKSLVAEGLSVSTVKGTYRAAIARVLKIGHGEGVLADNVAAGMEVRGPKAARVKRKDISDSEAQTILSAALAPQPLGISSHHALARRWAPWICAYTGARIAEITQLRACDIRLDEGVWVFHITPEAGSVKNNEFRLAPVHSHLIEQGILKLAKAGDETPLFYNPGAARKHDAVQKQPQQLASKLAKWVRALGVTEVPLPNHGWRHRFKTQARLVSIPADVRDAIQGHAARTQGEEYGGQPLGPLKEAIDRLPRYEVLRS